MAVEEPGAGRLLLQHGHLPGQRLRARGNDPRAPPERLAGHPPVHGGRAEDPEGDQFHFILELKPENGQMQPVFFGIECGDRTLAIQLFLNHREPGVKADLFAAVRENLRLLADVLEEDILLCVVETNSENWWAAGRIVNPETGYDERMPQIVTDAPAPELKPRPPDRRRT
ncbi:MULTISPECIES: tautomerase family protein [Actinomadura]|uniref:Tautomerase family protein n=1 Tax=Actinomadura yumaensis TaxID=111807 RepID=A0ABW2D185_9ACTN|nr:tautomerase family protein [Actinomadura sp. J1-007]